MAVTYGWLRPIAVTTDPGVYMDGDLRVTTASAIDGDAMAWSDDVETTQHMTRAWRTDTSGSNTDYTTVAVATFAPFIPAGEFIIEIRAQVISGHESGGGPWLLEAGVFDPGAPSVAADFATWHGPGDAPLPVAGFEWVRYTLPGDYLPNAATSGIAVRVAGWNQLVGSPELRVLVSEIRVWGGRAGGGLPPLRQDLCRDDRRVWPVSSQQVSLRRFGGYY